MGYFLTINISIINDLLNTHYYITNNNYLPSNVLSGLNTLACLILLALRKQSEFYHHDFTDEETDT